MKRKSHTKGMAFNLLSSEFIFTCLSWRILAYGIDHIFSKSYFFFPSCFQSQAKERQIFHGWYKHLDVCILFSLTGVCISLYFIVYFYCMCIGVLHVYMFEYHSAVPMEARKGVQIIWLWNYSCEPSGTCWELNPDSLQEQPVSTLNH